MPLYHITGLCPRTDIDMGRCGFCINLWPEWKDAVAKAGRTQADINKAIGNCARAWLDGCGFNAIFDPDEDPLERWAHDRMVGPKPKLGPNARPLYETFSIRVHWAEWGPEHISVPGNACGLDIDRSAICSPDGGVALLPHNVDSIAQAHLLLVVFTFFAEDLVLLPSVSSCSKTKNSHL